MSSSILFVSSSTAANGVTVDILCRNTKVVLDVFAVNMLKY